MTKRFKAAIIGGSGYGYTYPGSINYWSSMMYHVVDPKPFATRFFDGSSAEVPAD